VLVEVARNPALNDVMQQQFIEQRKSLMTHIFQQAADRGEIDQAAINDELWDLLPHYLVFRSIFPGHPPTQQTVQALVDEVMIPGLTPRGKPWSALYECVRYRLLCCPVRYRTV
jgi:hypothetical protein